MKIIKTRDCSGCGITIQVGLHHGSKCNTCYNKNVLAKYHKLIEIDPIRLQNNRSRAKEKNRERRLKVLTHYCGGLPPFCVCCGENEIKFLALDHIHGGGNKHRREIFGGNKVGCFTQWVAKNNFPEGFQVLCHNCNMAKGAWGECPHRRTQLASPEGAVTH